MTITNSNKEKIRDGLSKFPHFAVKELRGILHYLTEAYSSDDSGHSGLELPDKKVKIPSIYSDMYICVVLHELFECADSIERVVTVKRYGDYKIASY